MAVTMGLGHAPDLSSAFLYFIALFFSFFTLTNIGQKIERAVFHSELSIMWHYILALALITIFIISVGRIAYTPFNDFIYSRF